ncbi:MAG TPA: NAD(P)/FAD-dependent oxidoreductase, partial [Marmoricola sp.]|nr:NAD(P)/FAD-dependent oxidoreductase [Marmoricola sp.]
MSRTVAIVGGGFGGVGAAIRLTQQGHDVVAFEKSSRLGGVWNDNEYPGAACDIASHLYEYSFTPNPNWSRRFAPQAEIQAYIEDVAQRYGVADKVRLNTEVLSAEWDGSSWVLHTSAGEHRADVLVAACGQLQTPSIPPIAGLDSFTGKAFHTARWDSEAVLKGQRVGVIGSGCSAIQVVPAIQPEVEHLDVFQRSPGWTLPKGDRLYSEGAKRRFRRFPLLQRLSRRSLYWQQEVFTLAMTRYAVLRKLVAPLSKRQITKAIADPSLRAKVMPTDEIGCKRIMLTDAWYPALTQNNVDVVTDRIREVVPDGIVTADGEHHRLDVLVLATGFKSHEFVAPMEITGPAGRLRDSWAGVPKAYLGMSVPNFPNLFLIYGPNTNGGTGSVVVTLEACIEHVVEALNQMDRRNAATIEVTQQAATEFDVELRAALAKTV